MQQIDRTSIWFQMTNKETHEKFTTQNNTPCIQLLLYATNKQTWHLTLIYQ
jgi:hypothetical protein